MTLVAARAYRLDIIDGVYNDFRDEQGLRDECERGRILGMDGKTLIHPSQVGPCNEIFSPTEEEVDWSRKIIDAFGRKENEGKGVIVQAARRPLRELVEIPLESRSEHLHERREPQRGRGKRDRSFGERTMGVHQIELAAVSDKLEH